MRCCIHFLIFYILGISFRLQIIFLIHLFRNMLESVFDVNYSEKKHCLNNLAIENESGVNWLSALWLNENSNIKTTNASAHKFDSDWLFCIIQVLNSMNDEIWWTLDETKMWPLFIFEKIVIDLFGKNPIKNVICWRKYFIFRIDISKKKKYLWKSEFIAMFQEYRFRHNSTPSTNCTRCNITPDFWRKTTCSSEWINVTNTHTSQK